MLSFLYLLLLFIFLVDVFNSAIDVVFCVGVCVVVVVVVVVS